jgi:hypothetical protein
MSNKKSFFETIDDTMKEALRELEKKYKIKTTKEERDFFAFHFAVIASAIGTAIFMILQYFFID